MKRKFAQSTLEGWKLQQRVEKQSSGEASQNGDQSKLESSVEPKQVLKPISSSSGDSEHIAVPKVCLLDLPPEPYQPENQLPAPQNLPNRVINFQLRWYGEFKWLHYVPEKESVFCHTCIQGVKKGLFPSSLRVEPAFTENGFRKWKKGIEAFKKHQGIEQHQTVVAKIILAKQSNIEKSLDEASTTQISKNRKCLEAICTSLRYLAKQGLSIQGHDDETGNFMELLHLREDDTQELAQWLHRPKSYTSHEIRNEILEVMYSAVLRQIIDEIHLSKFFSVIVDETTDESTKEQLSITVRVVNKQLQPKEYFCGLYEMSETSGEHIANAIQDVLKRFNLSIDKLRGQCYDGASNMAGKFRGVQARIAEIEPRATYIHCFNHSLNLALQDAVRKIPLMRDTLQYVNDVALLIGRSAKRLSMYTEIGQELGEDQVLNLNALCPTRWSVRVKSLGRIIENYPTVLKTLEHLSSSNDQCAAKASGLLKNFEEYETLFAIITLHRLFLPCEGLAVMLQKPTVSLSGSIEAAQILIRLLRELLDDIYFESLEAEVSAKADSWQINPPTLPRKRRVPVRFLGTIAEPPQTSSISEHFKKIYKDSLDLLIEEIGHRFNQNGIKEFSNFEKVLLEEAYIDLPTTTTFLKKYDIDPNLLKAQLLILRSNPKNIRPTNLEEYFEAYTSLHGDVHTLLSEINLVLELLMVIPSSTATAERSFSTLRRVKTYLRSTMSQKRLNYLCVLHTYKELVDNLKIKSIMQEFVSRNAYRVSQFGKM